ncbi:NAD(P)-dependent oxidoreductase [Rhodothalassium salexigens]|uniref:NAD(P)-dependent oxidoreductase n=1 Tax=Rhodothalassium salexigens TaxID=1086 RepID=UPI0031FEF6CA
MNGKMLKFTDTPQAMPDKRPADTRAHDFAEIYTPFVQERAEEQAGRCSQCGIPFCQVHCPLHNNIPDWLKLVAEDRMEEAYEVASATNNMPEVCGRICPQDRLCEGNCVIEKEFDAVTIGAVEKHILDHAWAQGWVKPFTPPVERDQSVGIIGAGPGGLAAAEELRKRGYQVTVYDRYDRAGGLLIYGIPNFKLDKDIVARRHQRLVDSNIAFRLNTEVGRDITMAELRQTHDAVLIATGAYKARDLKVPGVGLGNVIPAMEFLTCSNRRGLGERVADFDSGRLDARGKRVVVIGGGDTAMDCVRTAIRQDAASVTCLYRRDRANMPGSQQEVKNAEEEGVAFHWLSAPEAIVGDQTVTGVRAYRMRLGARDATGRQAPEPVPDSTETIPADMVILALGYDAEDLPVLFGEPALEVNRWGTVKVDHTSMMTSLDGVFAAGDIVRGASLVVWAIRDGRDAAAAMHTWLSTKAGTRPHAAAIAAE